MWTCVGWANDLTGFAEWCDDRFQAASSVNGKTSKSIHHLPAWWGECHGNLVNAGKTGNLDFLLILGYLVCLWPHQQISMPSFLAHQSLQDGKGSVHHDESLELHQTSGSICTSWWDFLLVSFFLVKCKWIKECLGIPLLFWLAMSIVGMWRVADCILHYWDRDCHGLAKTGYYPWPLIHVIHGLDSWIYNEIHGYLWSVCYIWTTLMGAAAATHWCATALCKLEEVINFTPSLNKNTLQ